MKTMMIKRLESKGLVVPLLQVINRNRTKRKRITRRDQQETGKRVNKLKRKRISTHLLPDKRPIEVIMLSLGSLSQRDLLLLEMKK